MLITSTIFLWTVILVWIAAGSLIEFDPALCRDFNAGRCKEASIRNQCHNLCSDAPLCEYITANDCTHPLTAGRCPNKCQIECDTDAGFFKIPGSSKCYSLLAGKRSWEASKQHCIRGGLQLATEPDKPVELRKIIIEQHGINQRVWIGGKGTGSKTVAWVHDETLLSNSSPFWHPYYKGDSRATTGFCLDILTETRWNSHAAHPYFTDPCTDKYAALCELVK